MSSVETAALERVLARDARVATEEILAQVMLETEARNAVLFVDRGELNLKGGVGVDQECLDRVRAAWATGSAELREGHPLSSATWCLWPCSTPSGLVLVYLSGTALRLAQVRRTIGGIARLLSLLVSENPRPAKDEPQPSQVEQTAVDMFLRNATAEEVERRQLTILLNESEWNIALAARRRGVTRVTLYKWMRRLGVERLKIRRGLQRILATESAEGNGA
jgi:hypothetical protein